MATSNKWIQKHRLPVKVTAIPDGSPCLNCSQIQYSKDEAKAWVRCGYLDYGFPYQAHEMSQCPHFKQGNKNNADHITSRSQDQDDRQAADLAARD